MEDLEKILKEFLSIIDNERNREFRNEFLDRNNKPQIDAVTFDELLQDAHVRHKMNFFPSENKGACHELAMFVSFHKPIFGMKFKKDQMIPVDDVLKKLVQQVLGTCYPTNQKILLLTDKVDTAVFEPWFGNLKAIKRMGMELEIVYLRSNGSTENINSLVGI
jgi:hypothetical protein